MKQVSYGIDEREYDEFVANHPLCNLLQTSDWSKIKDSWKHELVGMYQDDKLVGSALVLIKQLPLGFKMMYIPRGPLIDYENQEAVGFFMSELRRWAKKQKCLFIKFDPGIHVNDYLIEEVNDNKRDVSKILTNLRQAGVKHLGYAMRIEESIQPRFQANVYYQENFLDNLPRHTRRLINDASKKGVTCKRVGLDRLDDFNMVVALTEERKQIALRNEAYFGKLLQTYGDNAWLYLAELRVKERLIILEKQQIENEKEFKNTSPNSRKKLNRLNDIKKSLAKEISDLKVLSETSEDVIVLAGVLSVKCGDTLEMLYAGMDDNFKKFMPQYYLYSQIMNDAFNAGCLYCNMGGVEGDLQDGLTKFKSNFNPMINEFIGEFELPTSPLYQLGKIAYKLYTKKGN